MSHVDELIEEIDKTPVDVMFGASRQRFIKNKLVIIQAEQEELQKKADAYDEQSKPIKLPPSFYETMNGYRDKGGFLAFLTDWYYDEYSDGDLESDFAVDYIEKNIETLMRAWLSDSAEQSKPVELSDAEWDEDDVILIMTDFHDEYLVDSENSVEISIKYAHKIIDLFETGVSDEIKRQIKPVEVPQFVADEIHDQRFNTGSCKQSNGLLLRNVFYDLHSPGTITKDDKRWTGGEFYEWLKRGDSDNVELFVKAVVFGYTVQQEQLYYMPLLYQKNKTLYYCFDKNGEITFGQGNLKADKYKFTKEQIEQYFPEITDRAIKE